VVALVAATTKTVLQLATPSTTDIRIAAWGVSFDGSSGTAVPGICHLMYGDVAATVTAMDPDRYESELDPASLCVGGTALSGYNASAEGTMTAIRYIAPPEQVHPESGYEVWFPDDKRAKVPASKFIRVRCKFPAIVNVIPWIIWSEPS
jgi:hypothetical protein